MSGKKCMCASQKLSDKSELLGQRITSWADLASCVCVRQWGTPVRTGMVAAPSCVIQKVTWFTAAADLVLHWLWMAATVKVKNHTCLCRSTLKEKENSFRFFRVNYNCRKPQNLSASWGCYRGWSWKLFSIWLSERRSQRNIRSDKAFLLDKMLQ